MGKIVKYCSSCDEGFAERFGFCPTCGASLQAFEMNPLDNEAVVSEEAAVAETAPLTEPEAMTAETFYEVAPEPEIETYAAPETVPAVEAGQIDQDDVEVSEPVEEEIPVTVAVPAAENFHMFDAMYADEPRHAYRSDEFMRGDDGGYYVTVIEEKNVKQRNLLLLASTLFCVTFLLGWTIYSLFDKELGVGAIDGDKLFSAVIVDEPMTVEEEQIKKDKDDGGGGGGGGKEEPDPVSQGDLPDQSKTPTRPPDPNVPRFDFELKTPPPQTEGTRKFAKDYGKWGDPNSTFTGTSSGPGSGGGTGTGYGPGVGSGRGTGTGSGTGSGSGSGNGDGDGDGTGTGGRGGAAPPPVRPPITKDLRIISKVKPPYTDAARMNSVTGTVTLRVTFLASGQIGSIVTINGLPHGLTEKAIAAARQIRFEPKMVNGVAQSVSRPVTFSFTLY